MRTPEHFVIEGGQVADKPYHYTECGLDSIYLLSGFTMETYDGEDYVSIENVDGLWKAIGLKLVTEQKVLSPREIRFLRDKMDKTQSELASLLRVDDQTVARWEKGRVRLPGPADIALRVLFLCSEVAQPEGGKILADWVHVIRDLVEQDQSSDLEMLFSRGDRGWRAEPRRAA